MSYTPTNWQTGDTVTAERLNKMENGIAAAVDPFIVNLTPTAQDFSGVMDKTLGEIKTAYKAGKQIVFRVLSSETRYTDIYSVSFDYDTADDALIFSTNIFVLDSHAFVIAYNVQLGDSTDVYSTTIYPLTPMS